VCLDVVFVVLLQDIESRSALSTSESSRQPCATCVSSLVIQHVYDTDCSCKFFVVAVLSLSLSNFIGCSCTTVLAAHSVVKSCHSVASTDCVQVEPKNYHAHNKRCSVQHFDLV